jgi:hypothetical protein
MHPPYDHPLNQTTQAVLTFASWAIAIALLVVAGYLSRKHRTPFHVLLVLSAAIAALAEPIYDIGFKLLFYTPGQWTLFTYSEIPQPVWTVSGYVTLYAGPALFICDKLLRGLDERAFWKWTAVTFLASTIFEIFGIQGGAYEYWGPHAFRVLGYPLVIGILQTTFVMLLSVCADALRRRVATQWGLTGLLILFPAVFYGVNFGIGAPTLVTIGLSPPSPQAVVIATLASITVAILVLATLGSFVASNCAATRSVRTFGAQPAGAFAPARNLGRSSP